MANNELWKSIVRIAIEFDGEHHFKPKYGEKMFEYTQKLDKLKDILCKEYEINLLRISYFDNWVDKNWVIEQVERLINGNN